MEGIVDEIFDELSQELGLSDEDLGTSNLLKAKIKRATNEVRLKRNYPSTFTDLQIETDLRKHKFVIYDLALYDFNQIGAEGQVSHAENGTNRTWKNRNNCLMGVVSFASSP